MDPMSAITAGLGALTSILKAVGSIADLITSGAELGTKILDSLKGMIKEPQSEEATQVTDQATTNWPTGERTYAINATNAVFNSTPSANASQLPIAA